MTRTGATNSRLAMYGPPMAITNRGAGVTRASTTSASVRTRVDDATKSVRTAALRASIDMSATNLYRC